MSNWKALQPIIKKKKYSSFSKTETSTSSTLLNKSDDVKAGKYIAIDCEMVGVGPNGSESALARVSIVNYNHQVILDEYVKPKERVTDYRTFVSGIEPKHLRDAKTFEQVQKMVYDVVSGKVLIGHAIHHDLKALMLDHPKHLIRDTSKYKPFRIQSKNRTPSLKSLSLHYLKETIQTGSHSSVVDAIMTMRLYQLVRNEWEKMFYKKKEREILKSRGNKNV